MASRSIDDIQMAEREFSGNPDAVQGFRLGILNDKIEQIQDATGAISLSETDKQRVAYALGGEGTEGFKKFINIIDTENTSARESKLADFMINYLGFIVGGSSLAGKAFGLF